MAQMGSLSLPALLDLGSCISVIYFRHFQQLKARDHDHSLGITDVSYVRASGQDLEILGQLELKLKIHGVCWPWVFLVSKGLRGNPFWGRILYPELRWFSN
jgi:hypothetical protein